MSALRLTNSDSPGFLIVHPSDGWSGGQAPRGEMEDVGGGEGMCLVNLQGVERSSDVQEEKKRRERWREGNKGERRRRRRREREEEKNERWKRVKELKSVHAHCRLMNLNCGISGIQTQSPNGNYQRKGERRGRLQAKNVKKDSTCCLCAFSFGKNTLGMFDSCTDLVLNLTPNLKIQNHLGNNSVSKEFIPRLILQKTICPASVSNLLGCSDGR